MLVFKVLDHPSGILTDDFHKGQAPLAPEGPFYLLQGSVVPNRSGKVDFEILTDEDKSGQLVTIVVENAKDYNLGSDGARKTSTEITLTGTRTIFPLTLAKGENILVAQIPNGEVAYLKVISSTIMTMWRSLARIAFKDVHEPIDENRQAIFSKIGTRLAEPLLPNIDLLPTDSLQSLAIRLSILSFMFKQGTHVGTLDLLKAMSFGAPAFRKIRSNEYDWDPSIALPKEASSQFGGEGHVWFKNLSYSRKSAFVKYMDNSGQQILDINNPGNLVFLESGRNYIEEDIFGLNTGFEDCLGDDFIEVLLTSMVTIKFCKYTYPFDFVIGQGSEIGGGPYTLDQGRTLDSNTPFDTDNLNYFSDGWVGLSLTGRFDGQLALDTQVVPASSFIGDVCAYKQPSTQVICDFVSTIALDPIVTTIAGTIGTSLPFFLASPNGSVWKVVSNIGVLTTILTPGATPSNYRIQRQDSVLVGFSVQNDGSLVVEDPPPFAATDADPLYISDLDGSIVQVTVNLSNQIVLVYFG